VSAHAAVAICVTRAVGRAEAGARLAAVPIRTGEAFVAGDGATGRGHRVAGHLLAARRALGIARSGDAAVEGPAIWIADHTDAALVAVVAARRDTMAVWLADPTIIAAILRAWRHARRPAAIAAAVAAGATDGSGGALVVRFAAVRGGEARAAQRRPAGCLLLTAATERGAVDWGPAQRIASWRRVSTWTDPTEHATGTAVLSAAACPSRIVPSCPARASTSARMLATIVALGASPRSTLSGGTAARAASHQRQQDQCCASLRRACGPSARDL
jgi:hypothetical protein